MKNLILIVLLFPAFSYSQDGYMQIYGGLSPKANDNKTVAGISVGGLVADAVGFGAGVGYIQFEKSYLPLTFDLSFFGTTGKVSPVFIGRAGYGIYNYQTEVSETGGAFTGSLNAGIAFPIAKMKLMFMGGVSTYGFSTQMTGFSKAKSDVTRYSITAGLKL
jgi:hypothetical protein